MTAERKLGSRQLAGPAQNSAGRHRARR